MSFRIFTAFVPPGAASDAFAISAGDVSGSLSGPDNVAEPGIAPTNIGATTFLRFVILGPVPADAAKRPTLLISAGTGAEVEVSTAFPAMVNIMDGVNTTEAASATRYDADANGVSLVKIFLFIPGSGYRIKIKNNDDQPRAFTLVAAGSLADSRQPWLDAFSPAPAASLILNYKLIVNQSLPQNLMLTNKGTGPLTVTGFSPPLGPEFSLLPGSLPLTIASNPPSATTLAVTYTAPSSPSTPDGITTVTSAFVSNDAGAGAIVGHNSAVTFVVDLQLPAFAPPPHEFSVNGADTDQGESLLTTVALNGRNFNVGTPVVKFGTAQASIVGAPTATQILVQVPDLLTGQYPVSVQTSAGTAVSQRQFSVTRRMPSFINSTPNRPAIYPYFGAPGSHVGLTGENFTLQGHLTPTVKFGSVDATVVGAPDDTYLTVAVPQMPRGSVKITVISGVASCEPVEFFRVT
jgi:hypothetical protein